MEAKNADLTARPITRSTEPSGGAFPRRARRWLTLGLPAAAIVVLAAVLSISGGAPGSALPVHLTPPTMVSPIRSGAVLVASGYVVVQRTAPLASQGTRRTVYLCVPH